MVEMKALKGFTNKRIKDGGARGDGSVLPGETFSTDWLHANELAVGKMAAAKDANDLAVEPTDEVPVTNQLSVQQLDAVNDRRGKVREAATKPGVVKV